MSIDLSSVDIYRMDSTDIIQTIEELRGRADEVEEESKEIAEETIERLEDELTMRGLR